MAVLFELHPDNPQQRLLNQAAQQIKEGGILAIPTDSSYALVARLDDKDAAKKLRQLRGLDERHLLTLMCRDLSEIAQFAKVDNQQYRLLKTATPGAYTFILQATKDVPRRVSHPSRKTIGIRIPDHKIALAFMQTVGEPLLSTTFIAPGEELPFTHVEDFAERYDHDLSGILSSGGYCPGIGTTIIDLTQTPPEVVRVGAADPQDIGL